MLYLERERTSIDKMFPRMPKIPIDTRSTPLNYQENTQ